MRVTIEFPDIPKTDAEYLEKAVDDTKFKDVTNHMITDLINGNYWIIG